MELSKKDTKMIQGLSVLAMLWLHLFCNNYQGYYQPSIFLRGVPVSFYIAQLCDCCVFGFAFCSGYSLMVQFEKENYYKKRLKSLLILLINYWIVLIVFSIVSIIFDQAEFMPGGIKEFVLNFLLLKNSYNGAWWYMFTYVMLVILSPIILKAVNKYPIVALIISFIIYFVAYYVRFKIEDKSWLLSELALFGMTLFEFNVGAFCFKKKLFSKVYNIWIKIPTIIRVISSCIIVICLLYIHTKVITSLFIAPLNGMILIMLFTFWKKPLFISKAIEFVGSHSTNLWLTHMFFFSVLFKDFVYIAKYPILIFALLLIITIMVSYCIKFLHKQITLRIVK